MNIVYHFQIDDLSKRINQTIKIALRFLIIENFDINWIKTLFVLQFRFNNNMNIIIERVFNKMTFDFLFRKIISVVTKISFEIHKSWSTALIDNFSIQKNRFVFRMKAANVIFFVVAKIKFIYNARHQFLKFNKKNNVYFKLHRNYFLLNKSNFKLFN